MDVDLNFVIQFMIRATHNYFFHLLSVKIQSNKTQHYSSWWTKIHRWSLPSALRRLGWNLYLGSIYFECIRHSTHNTWCVTPVSKSPHVLQSPVFFHWKWLFPRLYLPPIQSCLFHWTMIVRVYWILINYIWEHLKQSSKGLCSALYEYSTIFLHVKIRDYP